MVSSGDRSGRLSGQWIPFGEGRWGRPSGRGWVLCRFRWIGRSYFFSFLFVGFSDSNVDVCRDRPWQAYPITILTGAYIGYVAGSLIARTPLVYGKKIEFSESDEESDR